MHFDLAVPAQLSMALVPELLLFAGTMVLMLIAALPDRVTYRISVPAGRAVGAARAPLMASALAIILGVVLALLTGNA